jgi:hypothetical protein
MPLFSFFSVANEEINPTKKPITIDHIAIGALSTLSGKKYQQQTATTTPSIVPNHTRLDIMSASRINSIITDSSVKYNDFYLKLNQSKNISKKIIRPSAKPSIANQFGLNSTSV